MQSEKVFIETKNYQHAEKMSIKIDFVYDWIDKIN